MMEFKTIEELEEQIFRIKKEYRIKIAKKPIEEKIKDLVRLQELAVSIRSELKEPGYPWII